MQCQRLLCEMHNHHEPSNKLKDLYVPINLCKGLKCFPPKKPNELGTTQRTKRGPAEMPRNSAPEPPSPWQGCASARVAASARLAEFRGHATAKICRVPISQCLRPPPLDGYIRIGCFNGRIKNRMPTSVSVSL